MDRMRIDGLRVALIAHPRKEQSGAAVRLLDEAFRARGVVPRLETESARLAGLEGCSAPLEDLAVDCDLLVALGGDGLILNVAERLKDLALPVFGLNLGALGFLTCLHWSEYREAVDKIVRGDYTVSERTRLQVCLFRNGECLLEQTALNDAVISRGPSSQLIKIRAWIGSGFLTEYYADGLIIATPTGSTAYSLAAGGPIVSPDSGAFVITPICPHVLTNRSVITPESVELTFEAEDAAMLACDGREGLALRDGDRAIVKRHINPFRLATLPTLTFYEVLRAKMRWAGSNLRPGSSA